MSDTKTPSPYAAGDDDRLDDLVRRAAARTDVDRLALERLARRWRREMIAKTWTKVWLPLAAAACVALLATTAVLFIARPWDDNRQGAQGDARDGDPSRKKIEGESDTVDSPKLAGNAPQRAGAAGQATPYERLIMVAAFRGSTPTDDRPARSVRRNLVDRLTSMENVDDQTAEQIAAELDVSLAELEREVGQLCVILRGPRRRIAVDLLSHVATRRSLDVLLQLWTQSAFQDQLTPVVVRLASRSELAKCYAQAGSPDARRMLAEEFVEQVQSNDVGLLIEILAHTRQSPELLAALRRAEASMADPLFAALDHENRTVRYTAAWALGALNRPDVTSRLVDRVASGSRRQEALLALASSNEPNAVRFVAQAKTHAVLAMALRSAFVQAGASHLYYGG